LWLRDAHGTIAKPQAAEASRKVIAMNMNLPLLFAQAQPPFWGTQNVWVLVGLGILFLFGIFFILVFMSFLRLWIQCKLTGARIGILDLVGMKLRNVDYGLIVRQKIALVQAGVKVGTQELEAHYLSRGDVARTAAAVIAAHKAGIDLPWGIAAAIDLAGRNILDAVRTSVNPKVIDCPDPGKGRPTLDGVCKDGIQLKAKARVTVRTKLDRLVGGATEETIIARVGEGIVKAIGVAAHYKEVLSNPNMISQAVLKNSLDAQTAFEIVSIDVAEIDVGDNIGAILQANQAATDLRVAQAQAETRRAAAVATEQEMKALVEENRAKVILAEAEIPLAIASAFKNGNLGVMDYYNLKNLQSDTEMRSAIAATGQAPRATVDRNESRSN
jgi:uncharacterized protein YqfA (UPF0365 family)